MTAGAICMERPEVAVYLPLYSRGNKKTQDVLTLQLPGDKLRFWGWVNLWPLRRRSRIGGKSETINGKILSMAQDCLPSLLAPTMLHMLSQWGRRRGVRCIEASLRVLP